MSILKIVINSADTAGSIDNKLILAEGGNAPEGINKVAKYLQGLALGAGQGANMIVETGGVQSSGTITFASFTTGDTITINGVVLTGDTDFVTGPTDADTAKNAAAAINASSATGLDGVVVASASGAVVTIKAQDTGVLGDNITLAISANGSVSGANLSGGAEGTIKRIEAGRLPTA